MKLEHIAIDRLTVSPANMRARRKAGLSDILPSVRARGILVPLLVRPNGEPDRYEIVAGRRRYLAAQTVAVEQGDSPALPCAIMEDGDDAAAVEASLIENVARLDPDEVTQWETFARLVREGRKADEIAATFGIPERAVKRVLALGNLLPRIRALYRSGQIDAASIRHLTLASKAQQQEWLALRSDPNAFAPTGSALREWLFGGTAIPTSVALFDLASFEGEIVSDLFSEEQYFARAEDFWTAQMIAINARAGALRDEGWTVEILPIGQPFEHWEHRCVSKSKGGRVYIAISPRGEVAIHEGYLPAREARRLEQGQSTQIKPKRPELTSGLVEYIDLHRHAAVRAKLAEAPALALRLMLAHVIAGNGLWRVEAEHQRAQRPETADSLASASGNLLFAEKRQAAMDMLGLSGSAITGGFARDIPDIYTHLCALSDEAVMDLTAIVMAETLKAGCEVIELLGIQLVARMNEVWCADDALLDQLRDRELLDRIVAEMAGELVAKANAAETAKVKRRIIRDCLDGAHGRAKVDGWVPRWMAFPPSAYTDRGGVPTVDRWQTVQQADTPEPDAEPVSAEVEMMAEPKPELEEV